MTGEFCEFCEAVEHTPVCPIGRGLERFAIVDTHGGVRGYEWLPPQMAAEVREHIEWRRDLDRKILDELEAEFAAGKTAARSSGRSSMSETGRSQEPNPSSSSP